MTRDQPPSIVPDDVNIANYIAAVDHAAWRGATTDRTTDNGMTESVDYAAVPNIVKWLWSWIDKKWPSTSALHHRRRRALCPTFVSAWERWPTRTPATSSLSSTVPTATTSTRTAPPTTRRSSRR